MKVIFTTEKPIPIARMTPKSKGIALTGIEWAATPVRSGQANTFRAVTDKVGEGTIGYEVYLRHNLLSKETFLAHMLYLYCEACGLHATVSGMSAADIAQALLDDVITPYIQVVHKTASELAAYVGEGTVISVDGTIAIDDTANAYLAGIVEYMVSQHSELQAIGGTATLKSINGIRLNDGSLLEVSTILQPYSRSQWTRYGTNYYYSVDTIGWSYTVPARPSTGSVTERLLTFPAGGWVEYTSTTTQSYINIYKPSGARDTSLVTNPGYVFTIFAVASETVSNTLSIFYSNTTPAPTEVIGYNADATQFGGGIDKTVLWGSETPPTTIDTAGYSITRTVDYGIPTVLTDYRLEIDTGLSLNPFDPRDTALTGVIGITSVTSSVVAHTADWTDAYTIIAHGTGDVSGNFGVDIPAIAGDISTVTIVKAWGVSGVVGNVLSVPSQVMPTTGASGVSRLVRIQSIEQGWDDNYSLLRLKHVTRADNSEDVGKSATYDAIYLVSDTEDGAYTPLYNYFRTQKISWTGDSYATDKTYLQDFVVANRVAVLVLPHSMWVKVTLLGAENCDGEETSDPIFVEV